MTEELNINVYEVTLELLVPMTNEGTIGSLYDLETSKAMLEAQLKEAGMSATVTLEEVDEETREAFVTYLKDSGEIENLTKKEITQDGVAQSNHFGVTTLQ